MYGLYVLCRKIFEILFPHTVSLKHKVALAHMSRFARDRVVAN